MKKILAALLGVIATSVCMAGETEAVVKAFQEYKSAVLERKGQLAVGLVTKETVEEYQRYVDWALTADREALQSLSFMNRLQTLLLRHRIPAEQLRQMDGRAVFVHAVDQDWIGRQSVIRTELGKVDLANNDATAEMLVGGKTAPSRFLFRKEEGRWKFDLTQMIRATDQLLKAAAKKEEVTEDEYIFSALESVSGRKVDDTIWIPLQKQGSNGPAKGTQ